MSIRLSQSLAGLAIVVLVLVTSTTSLAQSDNLERSLVGSTWLAEDIGGHGVAHGVRTTIEFGAPGRIDGLAACNRYTGPVSFDRDGVAFGDLASTRMMCPDSIMDQEQRFFEALAKIDRLALADDGRTLIAYAGGAPVMRLSRTVEK